MQTLFSMSPRDAEHYAVRDEDRRLYIRLDDAKANLGLISGEASWYRRVSVTIANGDEVGVLVPEELQPTEDDAEAEDLHRTIIACLLARVPEPEISLNAAARRLAWGGDDRFAKYRKSDSKGHQRASETLRRAIVEACRRNFCIFSDGCSRGFTCNEEKNPVTLHRFDHPASAIDIASRATRVRGGRMIVSICRVPRVRDAGHSQPIDFIACPRMLCPTWDTPSVSHCFVACPSVPRVSPLKGSGGRGTRARTAFPLGRPVDETRHESSCR